MCGVHSQLLWQPLFSQAFSKCFIFCFFSGITKTHGAHSLVVKLRVVVPTSRVQFPLGTQEKIPFGDFLFGAQVNKIYLVYERELKAAAMSSLRDKRGGVAST